MLTGAVAAVLAAPMVIAGVGFGSTGTEKKFLYVQQHIVISMRFLLCFVIGVVGGSIAAGVQSAIGNVAAGKNHHYLSDFLVAHNSFIDDW